MRDLERIKKNIAILDNNRFGKLFGEILLKKVFNLKDSGVLEYDALDKDGNRVELKISRHLTKDEKITKENLIDKLDQENIFKYRKLLKNIEIKRMQTQGIHDHQAFDILYFSHLTDEGLQVCAFDYETMRKEDCFSWSKKSSNLSSFSYKAELWNNYLVPKYGVKTVDWENIIKLMENA